MSIRRYSAMESIEIISAPRRSASSTPRAVLPQPVGPVRISALRKISGFIQTDGGGPNLSAANLLWPRRVGRYGEGFMSVRKEETRFRAAEQALHLPGMLDRHGEKFLCRFSRQMAE